MEQIEKDAMVERKKRVLLCDDDASLLQVMSISLSNKGYDVFTARDGLMASVLIENNEFDAIITDLCMPWKNGFDLVHEAKSAGKAKVALMITGNNLPQVEEKAKELHVAEVFKKPFSFSALLEALAHHLSL